MHRDVSLHICVLRGSSLIEINEWFRRYTVKLMEVCSPDQADEVVKHVWSTWGCIESIEHLYLCYPTSPEQAAVDVYGCELRQALLTPS